MSDAIKSKEGFQDAVPVSLVNPNPNPHPNYNPNPNSLATRFAMQMALTLMACHMTRQFTF